MKSHVYRRLAAGTGLAALAILGAVSVSHSATRAETTASSRHPAQPSYVKPTVPPMQLGATEGETTTTTAAQP